MTLRERDPMQIVNMRLAAYYTPREAHRWLTEPHPQLEGRRAVDVIAGGGLDEVLAILDRLDGDGYL